MLSSDLQIHQRGDQLPPALKKDSDGKTVKISLQDCLACSGCVTTAETVLLQQQSLDEFISRLGAEGTVTAVSVSPQTRSSLAVYYGLSPSEVPPSPCPFIPLARAHCMTDLLCQPLHSPHSPERASCVAAHSLSVGPLHRYQAASRLAGFLKSIGVHAVLDVSSARDISLMEAAAEFCHRFRANSPSHSQPPPMQSAGTAGDEMDIDGGAGSESRDGAPPSPVHLPMLASACPG